MSSDSEAPGARTPKRARGKARVTQLLRAATTVFAAKGYEAATMTEIAARAGAPIGSLYQFFPVKSVLADTLVQNYAALLAADLRALQASADRIATPVLVASLFGLLRAHPRERAAAQPLAEARMSVQRRRTTFRRMVRREIAAILLVRAPRLGARGAREVAIVLLQLMKAGSMLGDEKDLPDRAACLRELRSVAVQYLDRRLPG